MITDWLKLGIVAPGGTTSYPRTMTATDQLTAILGERVFGWSVGPDPVRTERTVGCGVGLILGRERQMFSETTRSPPKLDSAGRREWWYRFGRGKLRRQASRRFRSYAKKAASATETEKGRELLVHTRLARLVRWRR